MALTDIAIIEDYPERIAPGTGGCLVADDCLRCPLSDCRPRRTERRTAPILLKPDTPQRRAWRERSARARQKRRE